MMTLMKRLCKEEEGQGMVEYGLILALIALAAVLVMGPLGNKIKATFTNANTLMP